MTTVVAAFDVDGTLTTVTASCRSSTRSSAAGRVAGCGCATRCALLGRAVLHRDRDGLKAVGDARPCSRATVRPPSSRPGRAFAGVVADSWLRPDTSARLRWHQRAGPRVVLVSASLGAYLRAAGRDARRRRRAVRPSCVVGADGRFTGGLRPELPRPRRRCVRLRAWLADQRPRRRRAVGVRRLGRRHAMLAVADHPFRRGGTPLGRGAGGPHDPRPGPRGAAEAVGQERARVRCAGRGRRARPTEPARAGRC